MKFRYTKWNGKELSDLRFDDLLNIFNRLLLQFSGDIDETLKWMQELNDRYGLFQMGMDFDDFIDRLEEEGYVKRNPDSYSLTSKGNQQIRKDSLKHIFSSLKPDIYGDHLIQNPGRDFEKSNETRPYEFGDNFTNLDVTSSLNNALRNHGIDDFGFDEKDLVSYETENAVTCATVLLVDISHSMILYGEDRITPAKQVALALSELIMKQLPRDKLNVCVFGDKAKEISVGDLPFLTEGPFHTNTKAGLRLARDILKRGKTTNKQIFMITDGKPSAIFHRGKLYKNSWGLDPLIVNQTLNEAAACKKDRIVISTFMIARDPYLQNFIEELTNVNQGKAFFASLKNLSEYVFVDYIRNRKRRVK